MSRKYYNNGIEQGLFEIGEQPEGWELGKLPTDITYEENIEENNIEENIVEDIKEEKSNTIILNDSIKSFMSKIIFPNKNVPAQKGKIVKHF